MAKNKKTTTPKRRSAAALAAGVRSGAGKHTDKRYRRNQKRRNYDVEDEMVGEITFDFAPEVPEEAKHTLLWLLPRSIECGLGRMASLRTSLPNTDHKVALLPENKIVYLFSYEDRDDDLLVTITVETLPIVEGGPRGRAGTAEIPSPPEGKTGID